MAINSEVNSESRATRIRRLVETGHTITFVFAIHVSARKLRSFGHRLVHLYGANLVHFTLSIPTSALLEQEKKWKWLNGSCGYPVRNNATWQE